MKTPTITAVAATAPFSAPALAALGLELDYVPECGITCVEQAVATQGCDPSLQECYCGHGFYGIFKDCALSTCTREDLPNGYVWGVTRCDPKSDFFVGPGVYDEMLRSHNGTVATRAPSNTAAWSPSTTLLSDRDWTLETPPGVKSVVHKTTAAEYITKASTTGATVTATRPATVTVSGAGITRAGMISVDLVLVAAMIFLL